MLGSCIAVRTFIIAAVAEHGNYSTFTLKCWAVVVPSFTLDTIDRSSGATA